MIRNAYQPRLGYRRRLGQGDPNAENASAQCGPAPDPSSSLYAQWQTCYNEAYHGGVEYGTTSPSQGLAAAVTAANIQAQQYTAGLINPLNLPIAAPALSTCPPGWALNGPTCQPINYAPPPPPPIAPPPITVTPVPVLQPGLQPIGASPGPILLDLPLNLNSVIPASSTASNFPLNTADIETVQQLMYEYGDTWDDAQMIVEEMYAAGVQPGDVTDNLALNYLTGITSATTSTAGATGTLSNFISSLESDITSSGIPTWAWAAGGVAALFLLFSGGRKKH